jgi:cytochrome c biogenesis protein CcmG/thiol:disulfide interchange protein DsbE
MRGLAIGVVAALAVGALALVLSGTPTTRPRPAPPLPTRVLVGPPTTLASLHGRPAIIVMWASWCGPCIKEAPQFARLAKALRGRAGLVGLDWSDSHGDAVAFVRRYHWTFPVLEDDSGTAGRRFGLVGLPTTVILDARGRIVKRLTGPQTSTGLLAAIAA